MNLFVLSSTLLLVTLAQDPGPGASPACNNQGRHLEHAAGPSPAISQDCAQITVSVGGASFSTPSSCIVAYSDYLESVYGCGPALSGSNGKSHASQATIYSYTDGGCPDLTGLGSGMSWSSWSEVPQNLVTIITGMTQCVAPMKHETFDWSADVSECSGTSQSEVVAPPGALQWFGDPRGLFDAVAARNPFETPYEEAMRWGGGTSDPLLRRVEEGFPILPGARVSGTVEVRSFAVGAIAPEYVDVVGLDGEVTSDGMFDLEQFETAHKGVQTMRITGRRYFDGKVLLRTTAGASEASAYGPDYPQGRLIWNIETLPYLRPVYLWLENPFQISRFSSHRYSSEDFGSSTVLSKVYSSGRQSYVDQRFVIDTYAATPPRILRSEILDAGGRRQEQVAFDDFREIAPGMWRPFSVVRTIYLDHRPEGHRVEWRLSIHSAKILKEDEIEALPLAMLDRSVAWNVWY